MKTKLIDTVILTLIIIAGGSTSGYYWNDKVSKEKNYLQEQVALKDQENKKLKKEVNELTDKNENTDNETDNQQNDKDQIMQKVLEDAKKNSPNVESAGVNKVKISGDWATAVFVPKDTAQYDSPIYVLQKVNDTWTVKNMGTGLSQSDYPDSSSDIW